MFPTIADNEIKPYICNIINSVVPSKPTQDPT